MFFPEYFAGILSSFEYHFNSLLLTFVTGVCSEIPCSNVSRYEGTSYLNFIAIQLTGCQGIQDLGVGNLGTYCKLTVIQLKVTSCCYNDLKKKNLKKKLSTKMLKLAKFCLKMYNLQNTAIKVTTIRRLLHLRSSHKEVS